MSSFCLVTGTRLQFGHSVSHANNKVARVFYPNVSNKWFYIAKLGRVRISVSRRGERTINKYGGLDQFLLNARNAKLTVEAKRLRKQIQSA